MASMSSSVTECVPVHDRDVWCGDGEARTLFKESDIGDTDGDVRVSSSRLGIRSASSAGRPGFRSEIQLNANAGRVMPAARLVFGRLQADRDHDPFDIYRRDLAAYRLIPLAGLGRPRRARSAFAWRPQAAGLGSATPRLQHPEWPAATFTTTPRSPTRTTPAWITT